MNRRSFLQALSASAGLGVARGRLAASAPPLVVMTVTGPIAAQDMGFTLPHEHILVDFIGAGRVTPLRYDRSRVIRRVLPHLEQLVRAGGRTFVECTPAYLGRDGAALKQLAERTHLQILTNTGYYGARQNRHLPPHAFTASADELAARWVREWTEGIDGTGIRPGFIKIGVDPGRLSPMDRKLVQAAARAHLQTGLTVAAHTGPAETAFEEIGVLRREGVAPSAWIWVHAQSEPDLQRHVDAARMGAWVEFDGFRPNQVDRYIDLLSNMQQHGLLGRTLVSQDAGWYHVGEPGGGRFQPFDPLLTELLPALRDAGFSEAELHQLTVANPAEAFAIRVRPERS